MLDTLKLPEHHYVNNGHGLKSWLLTKDHKRIAVLYLLSITFMFVFGGFAATIMRTNLLQPSGAVVVPPPIAP